MGEQHDPAGEPAALCSQPVYVAKRSEALRMQAETGAVGYIFRERAYKVERNSISSESRCQLGEVPGEGASTASAQVAKA